MHWKLVIRGTTFWHVGTKLGPWPLNIAYTSRIELCCTTIHRVAAVINRPNTDRSHSVIGRSAALSNCFLARTASRCRRAYILPPWFLLSFLFSTTNLLGHWTDLNQTWTHIHVWLLFEKFPQAYTPTGWGQKPLFRTDFELWPNISLQWNMVSTIGKKLINLQGLPTCPFYPKSYPP